MSQSPNSRGRLLFIVGETASGKSDTAMRIAREQGAPILSCDSVCFYRGMDIGSAKPDKVDQAEVRHFGIDLVDCATPYSIGDYVAYRDQVLQQLAAEPLVLVVGGSGFYLKSFFRQVMDGLEVSDAIRRQVVDLRENGGLALLIAELRRFNPRTEDLAGLDLANPVRVEKALMRCLASGRSYRAMRDTLDRLPTPLPDWDKEVVLIERPTSEMEQRNRQRVEVMFAAGLVAEVRQLRTQGLEQNPSACRAIGYAEVLDFLDGRQDLEKTKELIFYHTRQLMRRQRNWFRNQLPVRR